MENKKVYIHLKPFVEDRTAIVRIILTERGDGKTTALLSTAFTRGKERGKISVFARRYVSHITDTYINTCITNLKKVLPNVGKLTFSGSAKKDGVTLYEDGEPRILFVALSRADAIKSAVDFDTHTDLYIDEFIPLDDRYLKDEAIKIIEIWRTIDRDHSRVAGTAINFVMVAGNKVTAANPLFSYFNILPQMGVTHHRNGTILCFLWKRKQPQNDEERMGDIMDDLTRGTSYNGYLHGEAITKADHLIAAHTKVALPFKILIDGVFYTAYYAKKTSGLVIDYTAGRDAETFIAYGVKFGDALPLLQYNGALVDTLKKYLSRGQLYAATQRILEEAVTKIVKIIL